MVHAPSVLARDYGTDSLTVAQSTVGGARSHSLTPCKGTVPGDSEAGQAQELQGATGFASGLGLVER